MPQKNVYNNINTFDLCEGGWILQASEDVVVVCSCQRPKRRHYSGPTCFLPATVRAFFCPAGLHWAASNYAERIAITSWSYLLVAGLILACQKVPAGEPQPWGIHLAWQDDGLMIERAKGASPLEVTRALSATAARIQDMEAKWGPYAPELTPALAAAGREAEEYGQPETALELYRWALHSTRINQGLSSVDQLPLLERITDLLRDKGDTLQLANQIDYFYRLLGRGAKPWSDQRLRASVRWLSVHSELLASETWAGRESDVLFIINHGSELSEAVCADENWAVPWCKPVILELLKLYYLLDYRVDPLVVDEFGVSQDRYVGPYQQNANQSPGEYRLRGLERSLATKARGLIDRALVVHPDDHDLLLAKADWLLSQGRRSQALSIYRELNSRGDVDFSKPHPVPQVPVLHRDKRLSSGTSILDITATVTTRGKLQDLELEEVAGEEESMEGFARRQLREVLFRPALDASGQPAAAMVDWQVRVLR